MMQAEGNSSQELYSACGQASCWENMPCSSSRIANEGEMLKRVKRHWLKLVSVSVVPINSTALTLQPDGADLTCFKGVYDDREFGPPSREFAYILMRHTTNDVYFMNKSCSGRIAIDSLH